MLDFATQQLNAKRWPANHCSVVSTGPLGRVLISCQLHDSKSNANPWKSWIAIEIVYQRANHTHHEWHPNISTSARITFCCCLQTFYDTQAPQSRRPDKPSWGPALWGGARRWSPADLEAAGGLGSKRLSNEKAPEHSPQLRRWASLYLALK